jgi:dipeptidyl aminopeptidase/acylaminoacyl peptidase
MRSISSNLYWQPYDGSLQMELLVKVDPAHLGASPGSCSPDGKKVAVLENTGTDLNIAVLEISTGITTPFLISKFRESYPDISPDGRWIAYTSDESKRDEVWLRPFPPNPGGKHQVSSDGGVAPLWSRDGKRLFYRWRDQMWVAEVGNENGFTSKPRLLFQKRYGTTSPIRGYDLSLDGKRFLMVKAGQPRNTPVTEMILVQNWFEELKRLVPTGNK